MFRMTFALAPLPIFAFLTPLDATAQKVLLVTGENLELIEDSKSIEKFPKHFSNARSAIVELNTESMNADYGEYDLVVKDGYAGEYDWCLGETFSFSPFDKAYILRNQDLRATEEKWDWKGAVEGSPSSYAQFTIHQESGGVTGTIATPSTELTVRPIPGTNKHLVTEVDRSPRPGLTSWSRKFDKAANRLVKKYRDTQPRRLDSLLYSKLVSEHRKEVFATLHSEYFLVDNPEWGGVSAIAMHDGTPFMRLSSFEPEHVIREVADTVGPAFGWTGKEKLSVVSTFDGDEDYRYDYQQATKKGVLLEHAVVVLASKSTGGVSALLGDNIIRSWMIGLSKTKSPKGPNTRKLQQIVNKHVSKKFNDNSSQSRVYTMVDAPTLTAKYDRAEKNLRWKWLCTVQSTLLNSDDSQIWRMVVVDVEKGEVVSDLSLAPTATRDRN